MRTVQQRAHGLKAYRWVVYDGAKYRLAQPGETPDGFCVSTSGADRFTVGSFGELKLNDDILTQGASYGVGVDGALSASATPVAKATDTNVLLVAGTSIIGSGSGSGGSDPVPTTTTITLNDVTDMSPWGRAWAKLADDTAAKTQLNIFNLYANLAKKVTLFSSANQDRQYTFPNFSGTFALLEREQTFLARQHITGADPTAVAVDEVVLGGGSGWFGGKVQVYGDLANEANTNYATLLATESQIGHGVISTGGYYYSKTGLTILTQGSVQHDICFLADFDPSRNRGSSIAFRDKRDGIISGHIGHDTGASLRFSMLTEPDTVLDRKIYMLPSARVACVFDYAVPSALPDSVIIGEGRTIIKTDLGVGCVPGTFYADFTHATKCARFRGGAPVTANIGETRIGSGVQYQKSATDLMHQWNSNGLNGVYTAWANSDAQCGLIGSAKNLAGGAIGDFAVHALGSLYLTSGGGYPRVLIDSTTGVSTFYGIAPTSVAAGEVKIGGGQLWTAAADGVAIKAISGVQFGYSLGNYRALMIGGGNGSISLGVDVQTIAGGAFSGSSDIILKNTAQIIVPNAGGTDFVYVMAFDSGGTTTFRGTAPSSVAAGQVKIGGGITWSAAEVKGPLIRAYATAGNNAVFSAYEAGVAEWSFGKRAGGIFVFNSGGNFAGSDILSIGSNVVVAGSAPSSVAAGQVAIGGGELWAAGKARIGNMEIQTTGQINLPGGDSDSLGIFFNYSGYAGGTTRFRNTIIYDGKNTPLLNINGASGTLTFSGSAPSSVSAGEVKSGGGDLIAASKVSCAEKVRMTPEGGIAIRLTNKSGATSVKGRLVRASAGTNNAYELSGADVPNVIGVEYEAGIADGSECWVVVYGVAEVLLQNSTASTRGYWAKQSDTVAGRADITNALPPGGTIAALEDHGSEIGHCIESKTAGTDVLAKIVMHFN